MTVYEWLQRLTQQLAHLPNAPAEARWLFLAASKFQPHELITRSSETVSEPVASRLQEWAKSRSQQFPLAYLVGEKGFYKHTFSVREGVLIPRPETELVVEEALRRAPNSKRVADLGCGSGCIGLSLLCEWPSAQLWAIDQSKVAIRVTTENAHRLGVSERAHLVLSSVEAITIPEKFDLVVANPPYLAEDDPRVEEGVRKFEPASALFSGLAGLAAIEQWSAWAFQQLRPGGVWIFEFGAGQVGDAEAIIAELGFARVQVRQDLAGIERVISAVKSGELHHG